MERNRSTKNSGMSAGWLIKMAVRDSRRNKTRLLLFVSSIVLGIAAVVTVSSFQENLRKEIERQAATLVGADLVVDSRKNLSDSSLRLIDSLKEVSTKYAEEKSFLSMVLFQKNGGNRLVQIRGLKGDFPFYGEFKTNPKEAASNFQQKNSILVDKNLMLQFDAQVGDSVQIGRRMFQIEGELLQAPGQTGLSAAVAPTVLLPMGTLVSTGLLQKGSRINYQYYFKLPDSVQSHLLATRIGNQFEKEGLGAESIQMRKEQAGRSFGDLTKFLSLVGFVALLLGCIGVSSSVQIYIREKFISIAILRCLGVSGTQAFLIFMIQIVGIGLFGSLMGAALGVLIQQILPFVLRDLLPVEVEVVLSWLSIFKGIALGVLVALLFALLPLLSIKNISPLHTLQAPFLPKTYTNSRQRGFVFILVFLFIGGFGRTQLESWLQTFVFTFSVVAGYALLYGFSLALITLVKRFFPHSWGYVWRQGLSNLYRPNNQTVILVMAIGLATAFIGTLFFVKALLIEQVSFSTRGDQPNMVLFDIQSGQKEEVSEFVKSFGLPVIQEVPIVTMQLESINGYRQADVEKDSTTTLSARAFARELRVTFRDSLISSERITKGQWEGGVGKQGLPEISLEEEYAGRIGVEVGDEIVWNVQGVMVPTRVGSFRSVDWDRVQTNFRIVFPKGVIDEAPQFHVIMTRTPNEQASADFQVAVVKRFPTLSVIDLSLILAVLKDILSKVGFVIQFMAALSICTGFIVLASSILISRFQRIKETVLLRTLGAKKEQVLIITALEYFFLGALSSLAGILIALMSSWGLARFSFEIPFKPSVLVVFSLFAGVTLLTILVGMFNIKSVLRKSPLEVLRD